MRQFKISVAQLNVTPKGITYNVLAKGMYTNSFWCILDLSLCLQYLQQPFNCLDIHAFNIISFSLSSSLQIWSFRRVICLLHELLFSVCVAMSGGSRKNSTTLERQSDGNHEVNDVTARGFPIGAGGR